MTLYRYIQWKKQVASSVPFCLSSSLIVGVNYVTSSYMHYIYLSTVHMVTMHSIYTVASTQYSI